MEQSLTEIAPARRRRIRPRTRHGESEQQFRGDPSRGADNPHGDAEGSVPRRASPRSDAVCFDARPLAGQGRTDGCKALAEAVEFFRQYGDGCERTDRAWGWRLLGNSLLQFGPDGEAALKALMAEANNRELSDRAWRILYLKQGDQFFPVTEAEDAAAHKLHPWLK